MLRRGTGIARVACFIAVCSAWGCANDVGSVDEDLRLRISIGRRAPAEAPKESRWWVALNGASNAGEAELRDADWQVLGLAAPGTNEGLAYDAAHNLVQAGDAPSALGLRTFCGGLADGDTFTAGHDRQISGPTTGLINPKGIAVAKKHGVAIVANVGGSELLVFGGAAAGDVAPLATTPLPANAWDLVYDEPRDRAFVALTNGTVGVIDDYAANGWTGPVDRLITPSDRFGRKISTNLHGIDYDAYSDTLVVTDVGAPSLAVSPDFARDGSLYVFARASRARGLVRPQRVLRGDATRLGNPVDLQLDGDDARIAEKAQGKLLVFRDVMRGVSGDVAPDLVRPATAPESLARVPGPLTMVNASDLVGASTKLEGVLVTSNPSDPMSPVAGWLSTLAPNLQRPSQRAFDTGRESIENVTLGVDGDGYVVFDDSAGNGGVMVVGRIVARRGATFDARRDRIIAGPHTGLIAPKGVEVVDDASLLLVADIGTSQENAAVRVFSSCAAGDVSPLANVETDGARPWDIHHAAETDMLFAAFTNGTVGVYDEFSKTFGAHGPDRVIVPALHGERISVNLHGVRYDAPSDTLILADVGSAADNTDGQLFAIPGAGTADGMTDVSRRLAGPATLLGNPVDIAFDGKDLYVAEKANGLVLLFVNFLHGPSGDKAPQRQMIATAPESVVLVPWRH